MLEVARKLVPPFWQQLLLKVYSQKNQKLFAEQIRYTL